jgi:hypothetical protein
MRCWKQSDANRFDSKLEAQPVSVGPSRRAPGACRAPAGRTACQRGDARLMASLTEKLSETAHTWGRAVAPVAEWVTQALWSSLDSARKETTLPTRLTQRRRSEGRGNSFKERGDVGPRHPKICAVCGVEGVNFATAARAPSTRREGQWLTSLPSTT